MQKRKGKKTKKIRKILLTRIFSNKKKNNYKNENDSYKNI